MAAALMLAASGGATARAQGNTESVVQDASQASAQDGGQPAAQDALEAVAQAVAQDGGQAVAQDAPQAVAQPGGHGSPVLRTARLSFLAGAVSIVRADNTGEDTPALNMPLYAGTRIVTGDYGEAEIEFEDGSVARLVPRSTLGLDRLAAPEAGVARTDLSVGGGLVYFELRSTAAGGFRIFAAGTVASPTENATLRVRLDDPPASFAVLGGAARMEATGSTSDGFRIEVHAGETLTADATDLTRYFLSREIASETWDRWNDERDRAAEEDADRRTAARDGFAGEQGYGWGDLDANGSWYNVPGQGSLWQPDAADASFDPFGYGAWVWGNGAYLYASGYSWGWTPYRCGHWLWLAGFGWGWQPDGGCGRFGFGGFDGGGFAGGSGPPHYRPIKRPLPGPGAVHPIVIAHGPDGARPPVHRGGPVKLGGVLLKPLPPLGSAMRSDRELQGAQSPVLARDFPLEHGSGKPLLGRMPGGLGERHELPSARLPASAAEAPRRGSPAPGNARGRGGASPASASSSRASLPGAAVALPPAAAVLPSNLPPPPPPLPITPLPPLRTAPSPAPVYRAPAPAAPVTHPPPPVAAPARGGDTAPKGK